MGLTAQPVLPPEVWDGAACSLPCHCENRLSHHLLPDSQGAEGPGRVCEKLSMANSYKAQGIIMRRERGAAPGGSVGLECPAPPFLVGDLSRPFHSPSLVSFFEKWALMTSTWEADPVQEFPANSPRQGLAHTHAHRNPKHPPPAAHDRQSPG